ncbi:MAG: type VI secretion system baseplate subunit TssF [Pseudomonadaceae bacterium]
MSFNHYFQSELSALRDQGRRFAEHNPALAPYLASTSTDPDVERLLEGVAFLTGRLRQKLDDELPELTHSLMQLLWPDCLRPMPAVAMLQFEPLKRPLSALTIKRGTAVESRPVEGIRCRFQTTSDISLLPLELTNPQYHSHPTGARLAFTLQMTTDGNLADLQLRRLRLHLGGNSYSSRQLYLHLCRHLHSISLHPLDAGAQPLAGEVTCQLPVSHLQPCGFSSSEALLPDTNQGFSGYRHLQDYFAFAEKFLFVELSGLEQLTALGEPVLKQARGLRIEFGLRHPDCRQLNPEADMVQLYCTPIVNLFSHDASPIRLDGRQDRYLLRPAGLTPAQCEVFAVSQVTGWKPGGMGYRHYVPFESFEHDHLLGNPETPPHYSLRQRPALHGDHLETYLCFSLLQQDQQETLSIELTCTNQQWPGKLAQGDICQPCEGTPEFVQFRNIGRITPSYPSAVHKQGLWQLISSMALNYQTLEDIHALREALNCHDLPRHYDQSAGKISQRRMNALRSVRHRQTDRLFRGLPVRGVQSELEVDADSCGGTGEMFLFGSVMNEFLAQHAGINTFHQLVITSLQEERYQWVPRMGQQPLF